MFDILQYNKYMYYAYLGCYKEFYYSSVIINSNCPTQRMLIYLPTMYLPPNNRIA